MADFDYLQKLENDMPQQFKDKPNIEVLLKALAKQLQEVYQFFTDLRDKRSLQTAVGRQLDGIGDIVVLSRDDADMLAGLAERRLAMNDELYREYLLYKIHINTNTCTYLDVYRALKMFWNVSPLYYEERPEWPATMFFSTPVLRPEDMPDRLFRAPVIKAAGVMLKIMFTTEASEVKKTVHIGSAFFGNMTCTELPQLVWEQPMQQNINVAAQAENIMLTDLPQLAWRQGFAENIFAAAERGSISETELSKIKGEVR